MRLSPRIVRSVAHEIGQAADRVMDAYRSGRVTDEPHITSQVVGAIGERMRGWEHRGVRWNATTLRAGPGRAAQERRHGADILSVLSIDLDEFKIDKGFLVQAKRAEPRRPFPPGEWKRLQDQCHVMLKLTPDAFVFAYSARHGIQVIPAVAVIGNRGADLFELHHRRLQSFFELFIECFVGDARLDSPRIEVLDRLAAAHPEHVLHLTARQA